VSAPLCSTPCIDLLPFIRSTLFSQFQLTIHKSTCIWHIALQALANLSPVHYLLWKFSHLFSSLNFSCPSQNVFSAPFMSQGSLAELVHAPTPL
jgi:hypothetical protein